MKLRNKKTGEVWDVWSFYDGRQTINLKYSNNDVVALFECHSLSELNEEWEDYKPTEPLIKDEKIRKTVRAWAEADDVKEVTVEKDFSTYTFYPTDTDRVSISVWTDPSLSNLSKNRIYTIAELCGEDE